jgi:hypothetical protein
VLLERHPEAGERLWCHWSCVEAILSHDKA